jgi:hypothetical protein
VAERVQFVLNDRGRVGLAETLGPAVEKVEGTVVRVSEAGYDISVVGVTHIGGESARWNGEQVTLGTDHVTAFAVRRYQRSRTVLLAAGVTVGLLLFIFGRSLLGAGTEEPAPTPEPPPSLRLQVP